jgi:putative radical SAM enzyme (TIGR03279 family)
MSARIICVDKDSPAKKAGIKVGERLLSINHEPIRDVLDYRYYSAHDDLQLEILDKKNQRRIVRVRKDEYENLGLSFDEYLMDEQRSCKNNCVFCFIDQLPKNMRETLYYKDDDVRLSFLMGNYITLTNLSNEDIERIIKLKISPINLSIHATDPDVRVRMMKNPKAGNGYEIMSRFAAQGIYMQGQIVLVPGYNDKAHLLRSMKDLGKLYPYLQSVSIVPVGLTKYREGLTELRMFSKEEATGVIRQVSHFAEEFQAEHGSRMFFLADEWFVKAAMELPGVEYYEDFLQIENGVGLMASLKQEVNLALKDGIPACSKASLSIATGVAAAPFIRDLVDTISEKCNNLSCDVYAIHNHFFGENITVSGLVTGQDIERSLAGKKLGDRLLIPSSMLKHGENLFLDDMTVQELETKLQIRIVPVANDGWEFVDALCCVR